ncbi:AsmA family protein [Elioraea thermophila]|uniref:AsmA family protein n=1 Tax=Elioraea thermophila TaxID=2185104 RepID=UPI0018E505E1|nr:AsmA-like C-terminal region-containing protein [Elioraea thermophila]
MGSVLRSLAWLLAFVAAFGVLAAWLLPRHVDWSDYRAEVERVGSARLGREVRIDGAFALELLPQPRLTARGVSIGDAGDGFSGSAEELRLGLALAPLLRGEVVVTDLTLVAPRLRVAALTAPLWEVVGRPAIVLAGAEVRLERGEVEVGGARLGGVFARLSAEGVVGAYTAQGRFEVAGEPAEFSVALGQGGYEGAAPLELRLAWRGAAMRASGISWYGGFAFAGSVQVEGTDFSALLPGPALPFRAEARLSIEGAAATADQLQLEIGGSRFAGALSLRLDTAPRADLALAAVRLDLDPWVAPAPRLIAAPPFPIGLDLSVEAASLRGGLLRSLRVAAQIEADQIAINEAAAFLPGGAILAIGGSVSRSADGPRFDGLVELDAPDLPALLSWLGFSPPAGSVLRQAVLSGGVVASATAIRLDAGERTAIDGTPLTGTLVLEGRDPPSVSAALRTTHLDPLPWLELARGDPRAAFALPVAGALRLEVGAMPIGDFVARDVVLEASRPPGGGEGVIRLAIADIAGGRLSLSAVGTLAPEARLGAFDVAFEGGDVAGLVPLLPWHVVEAVRPLWQGGYTLRVAGRPEGAGLVVTSAIEALDARFEAAGRASADLARFEGRLALRHPGASRLLAALGLPETETWLGQGSLAVIADLARDGERLALRTVEVGIGEMRGRLSGELVLGAAGRRAALSVEAESLRLPGFDPRSSAPLPPDPFAGWTAAILLRAREVHAAGERLLESAEGALEVADGALTLSRLVAARGDGTISLRGRYDPPQGRLELEAEADRLPFDGPLFGLAIDVAGGRLSGLARLSAAGRSAVSLLGAVEGEAAVTVAEGTLIGIDLGRVTRALAGVEPPDRALDEVRAGLAGGTTPLSRAESALRVVAGTVLLERVEIASEEGAISLAGEIDVRTRSLDLSARIVPAAVGPPPRLGLRLTGAWERPARVPELAEVARFLAERAQRR